MEGREIQLETRHGNIYGMAYGTPEGTPVLALHGWQDNCASFSGLAPLLRGMQLIAVDLPGHGKSAWKNKEDYVFPSWVLDGFEIADALGWEKFSLMGHSMGAGIASLMAGTLPHRITKLVLIEGLGPLSTPAAKAPDLIRDRIGNFGRISEIRPAKSFEEAISRRITPAKLLLESSAKTLLERGLLEDGELLRFRHDPALKSPSVFRYTEEQVLAFLRGISAKTLVIRAKQGWSFDREKMEGRLEAVPTLERVEVDGGHHVHLDHPLRVLAPIEKFLTP